MILAAYCMVYMIQGITMGVFLHLMLTPGNRKMCFGAWGINAVMVGFLRILFINRQDMQAIMIVLSILYPVLVCLLLYKDALWIRLTAPVLLLCVTIGADSLCSLVFYLLFPEYLAAISQIGMRSLITGAAGEAAMIFIYLLTFQAWHMIRNRKLIRGYFPTLLLPAGQFCFAIAGVRSRAGYFAEFNVFFLLGELLGFALDIFWIYELWCRSRQAEIEEENRQLRRTMELEHVHYREIESKRELISKIRHDIKNQILTVENLIAQGQTDQAERLLDQLKEKVRDTNEYRYCAIPIINAVINEKSRECQDKNIRLETNIHLEESLPVEEVILCALFSNLLDNAVKSVSGMETKERWIRLSAVTAGGILIIKNQNPSKEPGAPMPGHGEGSRILSSIAEKFSGEYHTEYKNGIFTAVVSLGIRDESSSLR